jgi:putative thiamine transport system permease protein
MARTLRGLRPTAKALGGVVPLGVLWGVPLIVGCVAICLAAFDRTAWTALFSHPQIWPALRLSLFTGTASLVLSTLIAFWIIAGLHGSALCNNLQRLAGSFLALPHLAFAIGFGFLIMSSGVLARVVGAMAGWNSPPQWITVQDPFGFSLIAALVLKEVPFLLWLIAGLMARTDIAQMFEGQQRAARSMGHGSASIWLRLFIPQILPRLLWPIVIVWVYGASVVDMALAIGPTQPPTLAVIIWADLNNVDVATNARGTVGAVFLTVVLIVCAALCWLAFHVLNGRLRRFLTRGPSAAIAPQKSAAVLLAVITSIYVVVLLLLLVMSFAASWPYPAFMPTQFRLAAWSHIFASPHPLISSLLFACASVAVSIALAIAWLEGLPEAADRFLITLAVAALALPSLLIADGQYLAFLHAKLNSTWLGVFLGHLTPVFAYVFIVVKGPYRAFDPRYRWVSFGLNTSDGRFWLTIKMPLLKPALAASAAVGVAVSITQFVPVQLIAAGRLSTLTTEAVTLSSGGNRQLLAAFALMLMVIPLIAFMAAASLRKQPA